MSNDEDETYTGELDSVLIPNDKPSQEIKGVKVEVIPAPTEGGSGVDFSQQLPLHNVIGGLTVSTSKKGGTAIPNGKLIRLGDGSFVSVKRGRGRPRKIELAPTVSDLEYHAAASRAKAEFIASDPLVKAIIAKADSNIVLTHIKEQIAREAAELQFERSESDKLGKDGMLHSAKRVQALVKIADLEIEMKKLGGDVIDLKSERFQKIFAMLIDKMQEVARTTMPPEIADLFFTRLISEMEGWEEEAAAAAK